MGQMKNSDELISYAERYFFDAEHSLQVLKLSELLFECLAGLHKLSKSYLLSLQSAAILHDIGLHNGAIKHHKSSSDILLADPPPTIEPDILPRIACIARYHRKALPSHSHSVYAHLSSRERGVVQKLSAILRIADGLDYSHDSCVDSLACDIRSDKVIIQLKTKRDCSSGIQQALKKADLFQQIFGRDIEFQEK